MTPNHFSVFSLPIQFQIDASQLEQHYHALTARFHPDRFAAASVFEQKQAVMMAAVINEAYRILVHPIHRAAYLLELNGIIADAPEHTSFSADFLMQQMAWRERLMEAKINQNQDDLEELNQEIKECEVQLLNNLETAFQQQQFNEAADLVRQGRFLNKMQQEIQQAR